MRALVVPTRWERRIVLRALPGTRPVFKWDLPAWQRGEILVLETGMGPELAAAARATLATIAPREVWLVGVCGALRPDLAPGDLVLANATWMPDPAGTPDRLPHPLPGSQVDYLRHLAHRQQRRLAIGPILTSDRLLATAAAKRTAASSGALAVEMEAGPLARWTNRREIPFLHLRVVLDPLDTALPQGDDPDQALGMAALLLRPTYWPALWRLAACARAARRTLGRSVAALARPGAPLNPHPDQGMRE